MKNETKAILSELGFTSVESSIVTPNPSKGIGLDLTVTRNGSSMIVFCNGGQSEYDLLVNHGAIMGQSGAEFGDFEIESEHEVKTTGNGSVPYFTCRPDNLLTALQSIAFARLVTVAQSGQFTARNFLSRVWGVSWLQARHWINMLPTEENSLYARDIACDEFESSLAAA